MSTTNVPFRRVLVMGATQTGKSTLLSKAICGEFDEYYTPTHHAQTFYDCKRRLELIDTPGVADSVLTQYVLCPTLEPCV
jgi:predicted GTPase